MAKPTLILTKEGEVLTINTSKTKAIKFKCLDCIGFERKNVVKCEDKGCPLFSYRLGKNPHSAKKRNRKLKEYCINCMNGMKREVKKCETRTCPLYPHRIGAKKLDIIFRKKRKIKKVHIKRKKRTTK